MPTKSSRASKRGVGPCGNPYCQEPRAPESYLCKQHAREMARMREAHKADPKLTYNQRSDNQKRVMRDLQNHKKPKRAPKSPVCCLIGCFEPRVPPEPYCDAHAGEAIDD